MHIQPLAMRMVNRVGYSRVIGHYRQLISSLISAHIARAGSVEVFAGCSSGTGYMDARGVSAYG